MNGIQPNLPLSQLNNTPQKVEQRQGYGDPGLYLPPGNKQQNDDFAKKYNPLTATAGAAAESFTISVTSFNDAASLASETNGGGIQLNGLKNNISRQAHLEQSASFALGIYRADASLSRFGQPGGNRSIPVNLQKPKTYSEDAIADSVTRVLIPGDLAIAFKSNKEQLDKIEKSLPKDPYKGVLVTPEWKQASQTRRELIEKMKSYTVETATLIDKHLGDGDGRLSDVELASFIYLANADGKNGNVILTGAEVQEASELLRTNPEALKKRLLEDPLLKPATPATPPVVS
jgi:hypothetical protein